MAKTKKDEAPSEEEILKTAAEADESGTPGNDESGTPGDDEPVTPGDDESGTPAESFHELMAEGDKLLSLVDRKAEAIAVYVAALKTEKAKRQTGFSELEAKVEKLKAELAAETEAAKDEKKMAKAKKEAYAAVAEMQADLLKEVLSLEEKLEGYMKALAESGLVARRARVAISYLLKLKQTLK